jgi:two-component system cell cycle sensor histidine kinase/response regulator CckA
MPEPSAQIEFPSLLQNFPEPVFVLDSDVRLIALNQAAERLLGRKRADLISRNTRELLSPQSYELLRAQMQQAVGSFLVELELLCASGGTVAVDAYGSKDESGLVQFIARESSARRRFEEALRHSETRFRFMARNLTEMVLAYDMDRRLTFVNPAAQTLTGYTSEEFERAEFINWVHPEDRERMHGYWDRLFEGKAFHDEEYRLITRDGRVKWVSASWGPILDDLGRQVGVHGREREVTESRMAQETLRQSEQRHRLNEERYRALFEDSPFPMWEEDFSQLKPYLAELKRESASLRSYLASHPEAAAECLRRVRVLDVNRTAREFYGAETKDELLGSLDKIFDEPAWDNFREEIIELDANNSSYKAELQVRTIRGEERTVSMIVSVAASPDDWSRVIVSFFDITDRRRLEEQVLQSQKLESLGRLAGGIAHDFNNLLMVVMGYAELLLAESRGNESLVRGLNEIKSAGERGAELTGQLLAFSRKQVAHPRTLSLNGLIRQSHNMLQRVIGEDVRLEISLASDAWNIKVDRGQLHQVLMNLVVNGREAMPEGGSLSIATANVSGQPRPGDYVLLEVRDTGIGMDERTRRHMFEPFFTTKRNGKGTGLGMSTVFGVVTQAGGHIDVESEPGQGTVLRLYFPRDISAPVADFAVRESLPLTPMYGRVLVVEDQAEVRVVTCTILRGFGLEVIEAASGEAALAITERYSGEIDLLLTDVIMPGMNGRDLAARFAAKRPAAKVIYMSGYTDRIMSPDALLDNSVAFLQKPFMPEDLARMVARVLSR